MNSKRSFIAGSRRVGCLLLAAVLLGQTGCATKELWEQKAKEPEFRPSYDAQLRLFAAPAAADVLVQYEERKLSTYEPRPRAYFLLANAGPVAAGRAPVFVDPAKFTDLTPVAIHKTPPAVAPGAGYYAVLQERQWEFELRQGEQNLGIFRLPIYAQEGTKAVPVLLTPAALAVDAAKGATYLGMMPGWLYGGLLTIGR